MSKLVEVKRKIGSVAVEELYKEYNPNELFTSEIFHVSVVQNATILQLKEQININNSAFEVSNQRIFDAETKEELENEKEVPNSVILQLIDTPIQPQEIEIPFPLENMPLKFNYFSTILTLDTTHSHHTIAQVKKLLEEKYPFLSTNNFQLCSLSFLEDQNLLGIYKSMLESEDADIIRIVTSSEPSGGYSNNLAKQIVKEAKNDEHKDSLEKKLADGGVLDVFPALKIPAHYEWVLSLKDYSQPGARNDESLTEAQISALKRYTSDQDKYYLRINFLLGNLLSLNKADEEFVHTLILACCDSYQLNLPNLVYRWTKTTENEFNFYKQHEGRVVCIPSFTSTSRKEELSSFGDTKIIITLSKGKRRGAIYVAKYSPFGTSEDEILLSAFSFYQIKSVEVHEKLKIIRLDYRDALHHYNIHHH